MNRPLEVDQKYIDLHECPAVRLMVENISLEMNRGQYRNGPGEHSQPVFKKGQKYRFIVAAVPIKET